MVKMMDRKQWKVGQYHRTREGSEWEEKIRLYSVLQRDYILFTDRLFVIICVGNSGRHCGTKQNSQIWHVCVHVRRH